MKLQFTQKYFILNVLLFLLLVVIAVFVNDKFIRPFIGDVLAVIWLFTFIKSFIETNSHIVAITTLLFSYFVEFVQYIQLARILNITNKTLQIVIGSVFDWKDILAYTIGFIIIEIFIQKIRNKTDKL